MQKFRIVFKNIMFSFIVIFVFFIILEMACRIFISIRSSDSSYMKYGFVYLKPFFKKNFLVRKEDGKNEKVEYLIQAHGGSTTWGFGVEHNKECYPSQLELILREHFHTDKICVHNQGICAGTSFKVVEDILPALSAFLNRKTIFIIYSGVNDALRIYGAFLGHPEEQGGKTFAKFKLTPMQRIYFLLKKTVLFFSLTDGYYRSKNSKITYNSNAFFLTQRKIYNGNMSPEEYIQKQLESYENNLAIIIGICRLYNIKLIFGKEALNDKSEGGLDVKSFRKFYDMVFDKMEQIAKENNIPFVDADAYFKSLPNSKRFFIYSGQDWGHLNVEGNRLLAELFARTIIENNFIEFK